MCKIIMTYYNWGQFCFYQPRHHHSSDINNCWRRSNGDHNNRINRIQTSPSPSPQQMDHENRRWWLEQVLYPQLTSDYNWCSVVATENCHTRDVKHMSDMSVVINRLDIPEQQPERVDDDIEMMDRPEFNDRVLRCRICGGQSGSLMIVNHDIDCARNTYASNNVSTIVFHNTNAENDIIVNTSHQLSSYNFVRQRWYAFFNASTLFIRAYATFGLGPCIGVVACGRTTNNIFIAHIDAGTLNVMNTINRCFFNDQHIDFYVCGGSNETIDQMRSLLMSINGNNRYRVVYCHIIDNDSNSIGVSMINDVVNVYINNVIPCNVDVGSVAMLMMKTELHKM